MSATRESSAPRFEVGSSESVSRDRTSLVWRAPLPGLWNAEAGFGLAGLVERTTTGFLALDALGRPLGTFAALPEGQDAVEAAYDVASVHEDEFILPESRAIIGVVIVISAMAFASLVGAWLTSSL